MLLDPTQPFGGRADRQGDGSHLRPRMLFVGLFSDLRLRLSWFEAARFFLGTDLPGASHFMIQPSGDSTTS